MHLDEVRRKLVNRREALLRLATRQRADGDELLALREPDWEDAAAELRDARVLDRLATEEQRELAEIDAALGRIASGGWGTCIDCGKRITAARLRVRPESTRCRPCAERTGG